MRGDPLPGNGSSPDTSGSSVQQFSTLQFAITSAVLAVVWSALALFPMVQQSIRLVGDYIATVLVACAGAACGALRQSTEGNACSYGKSNEVATNFCQPLAGGAAMLMLCSVLVRLLPSLSLHMLRFCDFWHHMKYQAIQEC